MTHNLGHTNMNDDLIDRLRGLSRYAHDDKSIGDEAADEIERLRSIGREAAEAATMHQAEVLRLRAALRTCARQAEALKRDCGMDPESAQAIRNAQYQSISTTAHIALGTIKGPVT